MNEMELLDLIRENLSVYVNTREKLLNFIDKDIIRKLETLIFEVENTFNYKLADNACVALIVHLALAIERIKKDEKIRMDKVFYKDLKNMMSLK